MKTDHLFEDATKVLQEMVSKQDDLAWEGKPYRHLDLSIEKLRKQIEEDGLSLIPKF